MKPQLKIFFTDFWPVFNINDNIFVDLLSKEFDLMITPDDPEYLFYSVFGTEFHKYKCTRIFFTGENISPDFNECDYAFSFEIQKDNPRNYRLPQYYQYGDMYELTKPKDPQKILDGKTKFCNFIYSNPSCKKRNAFFKKLSRYKKVDSAGRFMNNINTQIGPTPQDKWDFMSPYKFSITFENEEARYYTTEKIYEAMKVNSIPIYWGNPEINLDFNTKSFLNYYDHGSDEKLIEKIIELDQDDEKYMEMLAQPYFDNNEPNQFVKDENIMKQFEYIFSNKITPAGLRSPYHRSNPALRIPGIAGIRLKHAMNQMARKIRYFSFHKISMKLKS